ncbi:MAG: hypothetical protein ACC656_02800 [Candidatus Heimdallarchaeota archaeon]
MFDHVAISLEMLPITTENLKLLQAKEYVGWQTKSMDNLMVTYTINPFQELWLLDGDWETVPEEERPYPNDTGIRSLFGSMRVVNERHEKLDFNGQIKFYGSIGNEIRSWFEFDATFINGKMTNIVCIQQPGQFIDPEIISVFNC